MPSRKFRRISSFDLILVVIFKDGSLQLTLLTQEASFLNCTFSCTCPLYRRSYWLEYGQS
jgi:hypothetical protein